MQQKNTSIIVLSIQIKNIDLDMQQKTKIIEKASS